MPQNYSGRVTVILVVLLGSLAIIFSPVLEKLFHPHEQITQLGQAQARHRHGRRHEPGLPDQVRAGHARTTRSLATKVATRSSGASTRTGVMNLIWRPQGADRLEIQMPSTGGEHQRGPRKAASSSSPPSSSSNRPTSRFHEVIDAVEQQQRPRPRRIRKARRRQQGPPRPVQADGRHVRPDRRPSATSRSTQRDPLAGGQAAAAVRAAQAQRRAHQPRRRTGCKDLLSDPAGRQKSAGAT